MNDVEPDPADQSRAPIGFTSEADLLESGTGDNVGAPSSFLQSRLSILHLFLLTFYIAVGMGGFRLLSATVNQEMPLNWRILSSIAAAVFGLSITASTQVVRMAWPTGEWGRLQAGHWLAIINSTSWLALGISALVYWLNTIIDNEMELILAGGLVMACSRLLPIVLASRLCHDTGAWTVYFAFRMILELVRVGAIVIWLLGIVLFTGQGPMLFTSYAFSLTMIVGLADPIWLIALVTFDIRGDTQRDWVHWAGIAVQILALGAVSQMTL